MGLKNKQIESLGIFILLMTLVGMIVYYTWFARKMDESLSITFIVCIVPFAVGLYTNASAPQKAQLLGAVWGVFISVVTKKMKIPEALKQIEIIIINAVNLWNDIIKQVEQPRGEQPSQEKELPPSSDV